MLLRYAAAAAYVLLCYMLLLCWQFDDMLRRHAYITLIRRYDTFERTSGAGADVASGRRTRCRVVTRVRLQRARYIRCLI